MCIYIESQGTVPRQPSRPRTRSCNTPQNSRNTRRPQENGILYGVAAAAGVVGLIGIIVVERSFRVRDLVALLMGISNTFALSVGLLLMGYGLVEIPRETWKSEPEQMLKWCAHR
jgi:hypothetical protein